MPSPYWAVAGTNPKRWLSTEREALKWRTADIDDCHAEANFVNSKQYLIWEAKVDFFGNCMKGKGYDFDSPVQTKRGMVVNGVPVAPDGDGITEQAAMLLPDNDDGKHSLPSYFVTLPATPLSFDITHGLISC
jgi:hypothetical protein